MFRTTKIGAEAPEYRRPTEPPRPMPDIDDRNIEAIPRELHDAAHRGIRTPEEFQTKYMGKWNVSSVPDTMRPCTAFDRPAFFHCWVTEEKALLNIEIMLREDGPAYKSMYIAFQEKGIIPPGCSVEKLRETRAVVEWPDGSVSTVPLDVVQFTDRQRGG